MTTYPGFAEPLTSSSEYLPHPGRTAGLTFPSAVNLAIGDLEPMRSVDTLEAAAAPTPIATVDHVGAAVDLTPGLDWFEKVHLLPRAQIDFGNIVSTVDEDFELFNAFRRTTVELSSILNPATLGLTLVDFPSVPALLHPFTSFLDPSSTFLSPVPTIIRAGVDGVAQFDSTVEFTFDQGGTLVLSVKGSRIALVTSRFEGDVTEIMEFLTSIVPKKSGKEQRVAYRRNPRWFFDATLRLEGTERQRWQIQLFDWQSRLLAVPLWHEEMALAVAVVGASTSSITVDSTADVDVRVGGQCALITDAGTFDVLIVSAVTSTTITFESVVQGSYPVGTAVVPVRLAYANPRVTSVRYPVNLQDLRILFEVYDNSTGAPAGSTTGWSTYNSKVLLDDENIIEGTMQEGFEQELWVVDNGTGRVYQTSPWDRNKHVFSKGFSMRTRAQVAKVRRLLLALRGRQVSFYVPTFIEDLTPTQALTSGAATLTVAHVGYTRHAQSRALKNVIRVTFTDGTTLERVIASSVEDSATEEILTLNTTWPANRSLDEIDRIEFYELARFDTDRLAIVHRRAGSASLRAPVKAVFDE